MSRIKAISPVDGRYGKETEVLESYFSEMALIKYRIVVEGEYLIALSKLGLNLRQLTLNEVGVIRALYNIAEEDALKVKEYEATTNHDVKSVEYYFKEKLKTTSLKDCLEWVHFALTSEDTNNLAYALMLSDSVSEVMLPTLNNLIKEIQVLAESGKEVVMLARTHGQSASPTTFGKEMMVFVERLKKQLLQLENFKISAKLNGATGNYNAHVVAYPKVDWKKFTVDFIESLNIFALPGVEPRKVLLQPNLVTAQIEPHDTYAELFDVFRRTNVILIDFNQDIWRYISDNWISQKATAGEVGSSTMPHKVNPINFENSEGNLGLANALLNFFSAKLPISRLQRDLSDSTVERNFGVALAHSLIAYRYTLKGLAKIAVNPAKISEDLQAHPEVIAEAIQTVLRREGIPMPYEQLKELTRGKQVKLSDITLFIESLGISEELKKELRNITPENYRGI